MSSSASACAASGVTGGGSDSHCRVTAWRSFMPATPMSRGVDAERARDALDRLRRRHAALLDPHEHVIARHRSARTRAPRRRRSPRRLVRSDAADARQVRGQVGQVHGPRRCSIAACVSRIALLSLSWSRAAATTAASRVAKPGRPAGRKRGIEAAALPYSILDARTGRQVDTAAFWDQRRRVARRVRRRGSPEPAPSLGPARGR